MSGRACEESGRGIIGSVEPEAAVAVVHVRTRDRVLLIRRSQRADDPWAGHWALPGGRRETDDVDLIATAIRETGEEVDLRLERTAAEGLPIAMAGRSVGHPIAVAPFYFELAATPTLRPDPREVAALHWIDLDRFRDPAHHRLGPVRPSHGAERWPHLLVDGAPLWGFTYRVLCRWLGIEAPFGLDGD